MKMKKLINWLAATTLIASSALNVANAHTTSIGFVPGTNAGEVTFWTGSYDHGGVPSNEGSLTLAGILGTTFGPVTQAFDITPISTKPTGLVDGTNNFYWPTVFGAPLDISLLTDPGIGGGVAWWQGITFSGLAAGDYSFSCGQTCGTTAQWDSWGPGTENIILTAGNIGTGIPEPGILALMGLGLIGVGIQRRKRSK